MRTVDVALQVLASSPALACRDFNAFYTRTQDVVRRRFAESIVLADGSGPQLVNTSKALSTPRTTTNEQFVLAGVNSPSKIQAILVKKNFLAAWTVAVTDGAGAIVASSRNIEKYLGKPASGDALRFLERRMDGVETGRTVDGTRVPIIVVRSIYSDWAAAIGVPLADFNRAVLGAFGWILGWMLVLVLLSLTLARVIGGRLTKTVGVLCRSAMKLESGRVVEVPAIGFREANEAGEAINRASVTIARSEASLRESETRMRSILESVPLAILAIDKQFQIAVFNAAASRMFGWRVDEAMGMPATWMIPERLRPAEARLHPTEKPMIPTLPPSLECRAACIAAAGSCRSRCLMPVAKPQAPSGTHW